MDETFSVPRTELESLDLDPEAIHLVQCISNRHGHQVFRLHVQDQARILKYYVNDANVPEIAH